MADGVKILAQVKLSKITLVNLSKFTAVCNFLLYSSHPGRVIMVIFLTKCYAILKWILFFKLGNVRFIQMNTETNN